MANVKLTPEIVRQIRDAVDVVDVASDLTTLKRQGRKYLGLCPFHKEKSPSFNVDPDLGLYHCFGCGAGGDGIKLHMEHTGDDFPAAMEALARRYGIALPVGGGSWGHSQARDLGNVLEAAQAFFRGQLERSDFARGYLAKRKITPELQRQYGLGYAPDSWHALLEHLRREYPEKDMVDAGLVGRSDHTGKLYDRFRQRLMFPIHSASGRLVGFGGRTLGDDRAKYINTAETEAFRKGELLYGLQQAKRAIRDGGKAYLVEGYFDVLGMVASGTSAAVAGMGTALTPEQGRLLARFADEVVLAYDGDAAGAKAASRALPILLGVGLGVRRAPFPAGHDPDSLRLESGPEAVQELLAAAEDGVWMEIERLCPPPGETDPRLKQRAAKEIRELLRPIQQPIVRNGYARRAAQRLGVPEGVLLRHDGAQLFAGAVVDQRRETRSEEQKAIALLLSEEARVPPIEDLPPTDAFLEAECRNIYAAFYDIYQQGGQIPDTQRVLDALLGNGVERDGENGQTVDAMARFLVQQPIPEETSDLLPTLGRLHARWLKRRQTEIQSEIGIAEQQGDQARLHTLLEEKAHLSRHRHPLMTGRLWSQSRP